MTESSPAILRLEHYQKLVEISKELVTNHDLSSLLTHIVQAACELSESQASSILLYNDSSHELYFQAATGIEEPTMRGIVIPLEGSLAGWVILNKKPVNVTDVHKDPRYYREVEEDSRIETTSLAGLPLMSQGKVIGVLEVINKKDTAFSSYDLEVLTVLASQAAMAIENTRLFQQSDQIAELVHELRTPLSSISTASYLLQQPTMPDEQRLALSKTIYNETQRLSELSSAFLDLARLESGRVSFRPIQFDLMELVNETIQVFSARATLLQVKIGTNIPEDLAPITADRDKLKQVFINLISNALKYNKPGGEISIQAVNNRSGITVKVSDTGIGMHEETVRHLFEKFYRAKNTEDSIPGTGLGLSICKTIIESHNGEMTAESVFGQGTTFTFTLPGKSVI